MENVKKAYDEILKTLKKHKDICVFDINDLERKAKVHIFGTELKEKYGLDIDPKRLSSLDYNNFGEWKVICWVGGKYRRKISWTVDDKQPEDELLLQIKFPTGANIFMVHGEHDYPTTFFQRFWLELKTYKPDYIDEVNHCLYWKLENAKNMFNSFDDILNKYYELNREDAKQRRIEKIKKELERLEKSS